MFFKTSVALAAAAAIVSAAPAPVQLESVKLPVKRVATFTSIKNVVEKGQAKISKINSPGVGLTARASSGTVTNEDVTYVAPVSIGGNTWSLIVDTGCKSSSLAYRRNNPR